MFAGGAVGTAAFTEFQLACLEVRLELGYATVDGFLSSLTADR